MSETENKRVNIGYRTVFCLVIFALFLWYLYIFSQMPYTHDDWDWGLSNGIEQLCSANINSRYVGNFLIVLLTRSEAFRNLFMAAVSAAIPVCLVKLSGCRGRVTIALLLFMNGLILSQSGGIWRETYGWTSGFANYVVSGLAVLLYLSAVERAFAGKKAGRGYLLLLVIFSVGIQLFIENLTIWLLASGVMLLLLALVMRRAIVEMTAMLAGLSVGTAIMFSSSVYKSLSETGMAIGGYRQITVSVEDGLGSMVSTVLSQLKWNISNLYCGQFKLSACLLLVLAVLFFVHACRRTQDLRSKLGMLALTGVDLALIALLWLVKSRGITGSWVALPGLTVFTVVLIQLLLLRFAFSERSYLYYAYIWLSMLLLYLPLTVTSTCGERVFLLPMIMQLLLTAKLIGQLCSCFPKIENDRRAVAAALAAALLLSWGPMVRKTLDYHRIGETKKGQIACIEQAKQNGADEIVLPAYDYDLEEEYLWYPHPEGEARKSFFKQFYGIDNDVALSFSAG